MIAAQARLIGVAAICAAATPIASCATLAGISYSKARTPIERAEAAYDRVRDIASAALPYMPPPVAAQAREDLAAADSAIAIVRRESGSAERVTALQDLVLSVARIAAAVAAH